MELETIKTLMEIEEKISEEIMEKTKEMEYDEIIDNINDCPLLHDYEIKFYTKAEQKEMKKLMQNVLMELLKAVDFQQHCNYTHLLKIYKNERKNKNDKN